MILTQIQHHAAYMSFLDGLSLLPQLSSYSSLALRQLKAELNSKLQSLVPISTSMAEIPREIVFDPTKYLQLGPFALSRGPEIFAEPTFNLQAPTSKENFMRVMRACQLAKPIMLEGSPGVGKTSLVTALAAMAGHRLCRINLSDQTDLVDLFGSDLPVEGGGPGEFAWKDAEFLTALQEGHWVLLDEMNLAPQPVLEGLNAVLDHRGTVYIPELNRSFSCHPRFRIFAAQNPLGQGGGRKGLPRSFLNRFTKVYIEELSPTDLLLVCSHLFPTIDSTTLQGMIAFNASINEECASHRLFGRDGSPWEFNLRDVIRWATLMSQQGLTSRPEDFVRQVYIDRFRTPADRDCAMALFKKFFPESNCCPDLSPHLLLTPSRIAIGHATLPRAQNASFSRPPRALRTHLQAAESISLCVSNSWLTVVTGPSNSGKNELIQLIANCAGQVLQVVPIHASTDTLDILGSFEQVGPDSVNRLLDEVGDFILKTRQFSDGSRSTSAISHATTISSALSTLKALPTMVIQYFEAHLNDLIARLTKAVHRPTQEGNFEWIDGPLVDAMRKGHWVLLDGANTCNPAVLDRLNSLCEPNGVLTLSERGYVSGSVQVLRPHPSFRLFMTVDPQYGELSRAMRNRGLEIHLGPISSLLDLRIIQDELRLPLDNDSSSVARAELTRRGLLLNEPRAISCDASFSSLPLIQHSFLSTVTTYAQVFTGGPEPAKSLVHYIYRTATPLHIVFYDRLFGSLSVEPPPFWNMLQTSLAPERQHELIKTCRANNSDRLLSEDALVRLLNSYPSLFLMSVAYGFLSCGKEFIE
jgi:midasin